MSESYSHEMEALAAGALTRHKRLRLRSEDARWLICEGAEFLANSDAEHANEHELRQRLTAMVKERYGNPALVWVLLKLILPVVLKVLLEWLENRQT